MAKYYSVLSGYGGHPVLPVVAVVDPTIQWDDNCNPYYNGIGRSVEDATDFTEGPIYYDAIYRRGAEISRAIALNLDAGLVNYVENKGAENANGRSTDVGASSTV